MAVEPDARACPLAALGVEFQHGLSRPRSG
jgi:hypothetical protein